MFFERYGGSMPANHRKVLRAIVACRTEKAGVNQYQCQGCESEVLQHRSCGNRHCPNCQHGKAQQWLQNKLEQQLPGPHFFITFTVPSQLRDFMRAHQKVGYEALFQCSSQALKELVADTKFVGGMAGFIGVLHTWGRTLSYHPHIHYIVPGGAIDRESNAWKRAQRGFFVPESALAKLMRGKFKAAMARAGLLTSIPDTVWQLDWKVKCTAPKASAEGALRYLAPYVFRVAISDARIVSVQDRSVTFRYRDSDTKESKVMTLDVLAFMHRFLQHVLPTGFHKVRAYGFLGSGCRIPHEKLVMMIELEHNYETKRPAVSKLEPPTLRCRNCGKPMKLKYVCLAHEYAAGVRPMLH